MWFEICFSMKNMLVKHIVKYPERYANKKSDNHWFNCSWTAWWSFRSITQTTNNNSSDWSPKFVENISIWDLLAIKLINFFKINWHPQDNRIYSKLTKEKTNSIELNIISSKCHHEINAFIRFFFFSINKIIIL